MKIKTVSERTGLTDRTVRYYIEEGLLSPTFTENYIGRKSFDFTEDDISNLNAIATLRSFNFSIEEIKQILNDPGSSVSIIRSVKNRINCELVADQKKISILSLLSESKEYNLHDLASELSKSADIIHSQESIKPRIGKRVISLLRGVAFFLAIWAPPALGASVTVISYVSYDNPIISVAFLLLTLFTMIPSFLSMLASKVKFLQNRAPRKLLLLLCLLCIPLSFYTASVSVKECEHSYRKLSPIIEASCTEDGRVVKKCDICASVVTEKLDRLKHSIAYDDGIAPTCTEYGLTKGSHCERCGTVIVKQEVIKKSEHTYVENITLPSCGRDGNVTFICNCGENYVEKTLFASEKHNFRKNGDMGYICSLCELEVCEYGNLNGYGSFQNNVVCYYITGTSDPINLQERTLVICGSGDMPTPSDGKHQPYRKSKYIEEIKTVIICDGITSIADGAFEGSVTDDNFFGNPFRSVNRFIVKGDILTIDPNDESISGIECDVTYIHG